MNKEWVDTGWWRVIESDKKSRRLWCETSDKEEAFKALRKCPYPAHLEIHQRIVATERWIEL